MKGRYISPFSTRYASKEMQYIFSEDKKFKTWRRLWIALARAEHQLGLPMTEEQIAELEAHKDDINYEDAERRERETRRFLQLWMRLRDRNNRYYRCPSCGQTARVPKHRGKLCIRCPKCGEKFIRKT